jgi:hypothetical protein
MGASLDGLEPHPPSLRGAAKASASGLRSAPFLNLLPYPPTFAALRQKFWPFAPLMSGKVFPPLSAAKHRKMALFPMCPPHRVSRDTVTAEVLRKSLSRPGSRRLPSRQVFLTLVLCP